MREFQSIMAPMFQDYIDFKRSLGYKMDNYYQLLGFDKFLNDNDYRKIGFDKDIYDNWSVKRPGEKGATLYKRTVAVKNFSIYLNHLGYSSYVPRVPKNCKSTFIPYIFTEDEISRFFKACDSMICSGYYYQSTYAIYPALFRLLYGTGLRISEALSIKLQDMDLEEGHLVIHETKNGEERIIPFSLSLQKVLKQYKVMYRDKVSGSDYFFVKRNGQRCKSSTVYENFRKVLHSAGISHGGKDYGPRLHDLRHSFSVHSLAKIASEGLDIYYCLPILSKYLGHKSLEATERYVRLTSEMYPELIDDMNSLCAYVFPEVKKL